MKGRAIVPGAKAVRINISLCVATNYALGELSRSMLLSKSEVIREGLYLLARHPELRRKERAA